MLETRTGFAVAPAPQGEGARRRDAPRSTSQWLIGAATAERALHLQGFFRGAGGEPQVVRQLRNPAWLRHGQV
jgi:hypothetical protein